ncbi:MAG TPA: oligosaccharide flippase family protein [Ramlibacter sp.]|jgi:O-antigen/teichoic acid export membrane protein|nr:oligosaccharide flippase family protein [Ramlibacter sp.]
MKRTLGAPGAFLHRLVRSPYWRTNTPLIIVQMGMAGLVGLCQMWALATYLPQEELGYWGYAAAIVAMASIFSLPGSSQALSYAAAHQMDGALRQTFTLRLKWGTLCGLSLALLAGFHHLSGHPTLAAMLAIAAVFVPVQLAADSADAYLAGRGEFRIAFVRKVVSYAGLSALVILTAAWFRDVLVCTLVNYLAGTLVNLAFMHLTQPLLRNHRRHDGLNGMNVRFGGLSMLSVVSANLERPVLGALAGFHQLATYQVARTAMFPVSFGRVVEKLLLSRLAGRSDRHRVLRDIVTGASLLFVSGWFVYAALCLVFQFLVTRFLPNYHDALALMYVLLLQLPFNWAAKPIQSWLYADQQHHRCYWFLSYTLPVSRLPLLLGGALLGGVAGAAWGWVLCEALFFFVAIFMLIVGRHAIAREAIK